MHEMLAPLLSTKQQVLAILQIFENLSLYKNFSALTHKLGNLHKLILVETREGHMSEQN